MSGLSDIRITPAPVTTRPGMVQALAREALDALERFLATGENQVVDLLGLPLLPADLAALRELLGTGEVRVAVEAAGPSEIWETAVSGVWWVRHCDRPEHIVAEYLEIGCTPLVLRSDPEDMREAAKHLRALLDKPSDSVTTRS